VGSGDDGGVAEETLILGVLCACLYGGGVAVVGTLATFRWDIESGGLIVVGAVLLYAGVAAVTTRINARKLA
jgi:ABC-type Mn2+/Zn2+ transport system permease subunit